MTAVATSTASEPTHHLSLTDGTTTRGLILCDGRGVPSASAIRRTPIQRSSLKFSQGETEYSDLEMPYTPIVQSDWSGGRGSENFDRDRSRFYDSWRAYTLKEGEIVLGGQETYTTGHRNANETAFTDVTWTALDEATRYLARKFSTSSAYTATYVYLWIRRIGTPTGTLTVGIYDDSTGDIGALKTGATATVTTTTIIDKESVWHKFTLGTVASLDGTYWIRIHDTVDATTANHWEVATHASTIGDTEQSADGSAWTDPASVGLYFRITDADDNFRAHFFEYRGGLYMAKNEDDLGAGKLYINGDRGACDTGTSTQVVDATKSWTTNEWAGRVVKIVAGAGSSDDPNWRYVASNTTTALTVDPAWKTTLTDGSAGFGSEYVILGSNKWTEVTGHGWTDPIVDVAVADEVVYFVMGEDFTNASKHFYSYKTSNNTGGAHVIEWRSEPRIPGASFLEVIRDPVDGLQLWSARNECIEEGKKVSIQRFTVPTWGGALAAPVLIDNCYDAWNESTNADVESTTMGVSGVHGIDKGIKIVVNDLATDLGAGEILATEVVSEFGSSNAIDIRHCKKVTTRIKSTIDLATGDIQLLLDDSASCASAVHSLNLPYLRANTWTDAEMDLTISDADGSEAIVSIGLNYVTDKTPNYTELLSNPGFETAGAGGNDIHANWTETKGSGTIANTTEGAEVHGGTDACKMTMTGAEADCFTLQTVVTTPGEWYIFQVWTRGDATVGGRYNIYDSTNSAEIVATTTTGVTGTTYTEVNKIFQAPADCILVSIILRCSTASGDVFFDDVRTVKAEFQIDVTAVYAIADYKHIAVGDQTELITGLAAYGDPKALWVFKEGSIWSVTNDIPTEVPIEELRAITSQYNGRTSVVNDVYLYFSADGGRIERYYRDNLDDVGPTRDAGLPYVRKGEINDLLTYPGMIIASVDGYRKKIYWDSPGGGSYTLPHNSCVLAYRNGGWHELFRSEWGSIRGMYIQSIPGTTIERLWMNIGTDIAWIPLSLNPYYDSNYPFTHESSVTSAWIYMQMQDIKKLFKSLKLVADRLSGTAQTVEVEYQTDDDTDEDTWNSVDDTDAPFNVSPTEELDFSTDTPPDVTGRRIRYRLRLLTTDNAKTPRVRATVLEAVARVAVKYQYDITFRATDESLDLEGDEDDFTTVETLTATLDDWATSNTPLWARFMFSPFDSVAGSVTGRAVFIEPASLQPLYVVPDDQLETHVGQCTLVEA